MNSKCFRNECEPHASAGLHEQCSARPEVRDTQRRSFTKTHGREYFSGLAMKKKAPGLAMEILQRKLQVWPWIHFRCRHEKSSSRSGHGRFSCFPPRSQGCTHVKFEAGTIGSIAEATLKDLTPWSTS